MSLKARKKIIVQAAALVAAGVSQMAIAQTAAAPQLERVVVTGSNIKRVEAETAEPILKISRDDIANSGKATLTEYLQSLSLDGQGSLPTGFGNGFAAGATAISLRGLGANATLVLLNGRRLAPYPRADDFQKMFADLSSVPLEAVDRIEVLKDGASAVYGSDALAGVVNIILKRDYKGFVGKVETGTSRYGDGNRAKAAITAGAGDMATDKWNILLNIEASKTDEIHYRDRDRKWIGKGDTRPWGYDAFESQWTPGYNVGNTASASVAGLIRNGTTSGAYQTVSPCTSALTAVVMPKFTGDNGCSYDIGQLRSFQPKLQSLSMFTRGTVALSDEWEASVEASFGQNKTGFDVSLLGTPGTIVGPYGVRGYGTGINVPELTLSANHPDNPFGKAVRFRYAFGEFGPQRRTNDVDISRVMASVKGTAAGWDIDAAIAHSESKLDQDYTLLSIQGLINAFSSPTTPSLGYYRMGANAGSNSQLLRDSILTHGVSISKTKLDIVDIKASRELVELPGGPLGLALGAEYRKLNLSAPSLSGTDTGAVQASYNGFFGSEKVSAAYAELLAPVVKSVELSAAVRYDKYDSFSSTTPKVAAKFVPIPQLALRASYAEGFRAPNPAEASPNAQAVFATGSIYDPVRCPNHVQAPGATAADCNGSAVGGFARGNPDLKPEKSKNINFGFIVEPMKNLNFGADFWQIKKTDQIQSISGQEAFNRPDVVRSDNNLVDANGNVIPNSGSAILIYAPFVNKGSSKVSGVDFDFGYRWSIENIGRFKADLHWTRTQKWQLTDNGETLDYAGTHGNCDVSNCIGTPKDKANVAVTWETSTFGLTALMNWRSSLENRNFKGDDCQQSFADGTPANGCKLPSFYSVDLSGRWNITRSLQLYGSISNLFDRVAPIDTITYGGINYNPMDVAGAMGRYYNIGLRYQFR